MTKTNTALIIIALIILVVVLYYFLDTIMDILTGFGVI